MESSIKVMDVWLALFFVFSGYLFPVELFPAWRAGGRRLAAVPLPDWPAGGAADGRHRCGEALGLLARQWIWVALLLDAGRRAVAAGAEALRGYGG